MSDGTNLVRRFALFSITEATTSETKMQAKGMIKTTNPRMHRFIAVQR
jgi:hypothetical protein